MVDYKLRLLGGRELAVDRPSRVRDGRELAVDRRSRVRDGRELAVDRGSRVRDGCELVVRDPSRVRDAQEHTICDPVPVRQGRQAKSGPDGLGFQPGVEPVVVLDRSRTATGLPTLLDTLRRPSIAHLSLQKTFRGSLIEWMAVLGTILTRRMVSAYRYAVALGNHFSLSRTMSSAAPEFHSS